MKPDNFKENASSRGSDAGLVGEFKDYVNEKMIERDMMKMIEEDKEIMIKKFSAIKEHNRRFQKFIRTFMENENEFAQKLSSLKITIKKNTKQENKRITP